MLPSLCQEENGTSDVEVVDLEQKISLSPFDLIGSWDKETSANVSVAIFATAGAAFSHHKHYIKFTKGYYSSNSIRIDNVKIPYSSERGYGQNYIYICLPDIIEKLIKTNVAKNFKNLVGSKYHGEVGEWWKPAYNIEGLFKVTERNQICTPVSLKKILNLSKMGVQANILVEFSTRRTYSIEEDVINVEIKSGFITSTGIDIKLPTPRGIIPGQPMPQDITSEDTMKKIEQFRDVPS